jgi:3-oxoacyl-[acyl-carrier-protein] synthase III
MTDRFACVAGVGSSLPDRVVTNEDLERLIDTSDEWIRRRTGIQARRFAASEDTAASLAGEAASAALDAARVDPAAIDAIIVATITGDQPMPSTASFVQQRLGMSGAAFDVQAACAGFVYALDIASARIRAGLDDTALVIGTEVLSRFLDMSDRTTCVLFGDGAGAAVLTPGDAPGLVGSELQADGQYAGLLEIPAGGSREPASEASVIGRRHVIRMYDGGEVFRRAVDCMAQSIATLLEKHGFGAEDVSLLVPHQANVRILKAVADRMAFPMDRVFVDLDRVGNTSAASVPIALDHAWREGRLRAGDLVVTAAFGAGLTWGANVLRWTAPAPEAV